jgi:hypothetical protein
MGMYGSERSRWLSFSLALCTASVKLSKPIPPSFLAAYSNAVGNPGRPFEICRSVLEIAPIVLSERPAHEFCLYRVVSWVRHRLVTLLSPRRNVLAVQPRRCRRIVSRARHAYCSAIIHLSICAAGASNSRCAATDVAPSCRK